MDSKVIQCEQGEIWFKWCSSWKKAQLYSDVLGAGDTDSILAMTLVHTSKVLMNGLNLRQKKINILLTAMGEQKTVPSHVMAAKAVSQESPLTISAETEAQRCLLLCSSGWVRDYFQHSWNDSVVSARASLSSTLFTEWSNTELFWTQDTSNGKWISWCTVTATVSHNNCPAWA